MSTAIRGDSRGGPVGALHLVAPEILADETDGLREIPEPVNGHRYGPPCPCCDEDGQD